MYFYTMKQAHKNNNSTVRHKYKWILISMGYLKQFILPVSLSRCDFNECGQTDEWTSYCERDSAGAEKDASRASKLTISKQVPVKNYLKRWSLSYKTDCS
jgi:hypothetical protein